MASVASIRGYPAGAAYCAGKHGLLGLARALRLAVAIDPAAKVVENGDVDHRTECRTWKLRTVTVEINGVRRRIQIWQTLRTVKRAYLVRVDGRVQTRTRLVGKWTGPGNLLNL